MYVEADFCDAAEQERSLPGWIQEYRQVSCGQFQGHVSALLYPRLHIIRERMNVATEQMFSAPEDSLIFFDYCSESDHRRLVFGNDYDSPAGFASDWNDRAGMMHGDSDLLMVVVDQTLLPEEARGRSGGFDVSNEPARRLAEWLRSVMHTLADPTFGTQARHQLDTILPDLLLDRLNGLLWQSELVQPPQPVNAELVYRKLRAALLESPENLHTVAALSRSLDIHPSVLRQTCAQFTGIQLDHFLVLLRLNGARRQLMAASGTRSKVSDIAMSWGFMHWSRFAARYRALFGETPSQTLRSPIVRH